MTINMTTLGIALWITFLIGRFVRGWCQADGQQVSPQATWGLIGVGLAAMVCMITVICERAS
jgi:hypothetical protein